MVGVSCCIEIIDWLMGGGGGEGEGGGVVSVAFSLKKKAPESISACYACIDGGRFSFFCSG